MQKNTLPTIIREEIVRAVIFAATLFAILISGFATLAYAADGGLFGEMLNKILVKTWNDPTNDGTVANCAKLGDKAPSEYIQVGPSGFSCGANQCIAGFVNGVPQCR